METQSRAVIISYWALPSIYLPTRQCSSFTATTMLSVSARAVTLTKHVWRDPTMLSSDRPDPAGQHLTEAAEMNVSISPNSGKQILWHYTLEDQRQ